MAQVAALVDALKSALKSAGITYSAVAAGLGLSESSVKRKFSRQEFTLSELDAICALCELDISDLVKLMENRRGRLRALTADQEREIAADLRLLLVTVCVLNRWTFDNILEYYVFDELELVQMLAKLDRLRIIELQPGNRIRLLVAPNFHWLPNGPIEQVFLKAIQRDFFSTRFEREDQALIVLNGMLSPAANASFRKKMERLAQEFDLLNREESSLTIEERSGYTVLLALRDWRYEQFASLRAPDH